jgi:hypothetical protein
MNDADGTRLLALLEEVRDGQRQQLERQSEALELQRRQFALVQEQTTRAERIQQKAELLQDRGASLVRGARRAVIVLIPVIAVLLGYVTWLLLRSRH